METTRQGSPALLEEVAARGWRLTRLANSAGSLPGGELDSALRLALDLAGEPCGEADAAAWREPLIVEAKRRLYPETFPAPSPSVAKVDGYFVPLAKVVLAEQARGGEGLAARLPFTPLADEEIGRWPSGEEYRRLLRCVDDDAVLVCLAMVQAWQGFSTYEHVLGVTGLALWIGRQLAKVAAVDLPLLHGAALGHDIGKFGCVGDEVRRIPRLHYYYTHTWYQDRGLLSIGHIATTHSVWDLELVRLPVETLLLIYADFRVKESAGPGEGMGIISLAESFATIRDKLENLDREKIRRYRGVYRKLRDFEEYLQYLGVELDPPGFAGPPPPRPACPKELDIVAVLAGRERPDAVALATGRTLATVRRLLVTAHNVGVMERLRDLPALRALIEEARSFESWRDLRTYQTILSEYAPALSREQKALAFDFFMELLGHRDDDVRYHASNGLGDLLAGPEDFWRKDLPDGIVLRPERVMLDELERVLALLDRAQPQAEEDMAATERVLYAVPIVLRRLMRRAAPERRRQAWERIDASFARRLGDPRPLVGLYVCESLEVCLEHLPAEDQPGLLRFAEAWCEHPVSATRLMAWRLLLALARRTRGRPETAAAIARRVEALAGLGGERSVAELFLLQQMAAACGRPELAGSGPPERSADRDPVREVLLRNLKSRVDWVEKKVNCDFLVASALARQREDSDPGAYFANEIASHFANLLKVSRVEGTRFHAGRCLLELLPILTAPQRNDVMVELLRSLELDIEAITRYIPRFLASVLASLPEQEFVEALDDIEGNVRRGAEPLQRLLLQTAGWVLTALPADRLDAKVLRRLAGMLLGALAESRASTPVEGFAQIAMLLERLGERPDDGRMRAFLLLVTKKLLTLVTHRSGDRVRFFLVGSALNHIDEAIAGVRPALRAPEHPSVAFIPGTFDPFTSAHQEVVAKALESAAEAVVQMDDYSWRKHSLPRRLREELAWMALAEMPDAYLAPFRPPVNLARPSGMRKLRHAFGPRELTLVVGSDVLCGASAYGDPEGEIWDVPHLVVVRDGARTDGLAERIARFRAGAAVVPVAERARGVSSTALRSALDRHADLDALCHPLVARTLLERRLYVNYPAYKEQVPPPAERFSCEGEAAAVDGLAPAAGIELAREDAAALDAATACTLTGGGAHPAALASVAWRTVPAAALPVVLGDEGLAHPAGGRLLGQGALVETVGLAPGGDGVARLQRLLAAALGRWLDAGMLFAVLPPGKEPALASALRRLGAAPARDAAGLADGLAVLRLENPLVLLWDVENVLQPPYAAAPAVRQALDDGRAAVAEFFAALKPGRALLQLSEEQLKRRVVQWAIEILGDQPPRRRWVTLGLGRQFSRDLVGNGPTLAVDLERCLTWQGFEGGTLPRVGSPSLELQLAVARELARNALVLAPFLESADAVVRLVETAREVGLPVREVLIGVTSASVRAALDLRGIPHRCGAVVPGWKGVLRESAMVPYVGGWSICGRDPLEIGSLLPSLNDCLPYHYPHHLGLDAGQALDFSRLVLHRGRTLLLALEETFRAREGRLLAVQDLGAAVRSPRCPPVPQGFLPPRDRFPSDLVGEDIEALARLLPETHAAHFESRRER